jgi:hypothetical protein
MPENMPKKSNLSLVNRITHSNITRIVLLLVVLSLYTIFLSPTVEGFLTENFSSVVRGNSTVQVNSLSPIFDIHVYAGEYNLSSSQSTGGTIPSRTNFLTLDPRVVAMNKFLNDYHSPMAQHAELFIIEADRHGLDWRLIASISGVESAFGNLIPKGTNNGWGWRGKDRNEDGWSVFPTWEDAITHITERMALGYGTDLTPYDIESTYCPPCGETGLHLWANGVNRFMNELQYYVDNLENL